MSMNSCPFQVVYKAASNGLTPIVEVLVAEGAELGPALFGAAEGGHTCLVKNLLEKKAPLDWQCTTGVDTWKVGIEASIVELLSQLAC